MNITVVIETPVVETYVWRRQSETPAKTKHFYICICFSAQLKALIAVSTLKMDALYFMRNEH